MKINLCEAKKVKPDFSRLGFGKFFTDHMLVMDYDNGKWNEMEIVPYQDFSFPPSTSVLHYGQGIFDGLKAYKNKKGEISLFRVYDNFHRINNSARHLCMPQIDVDEVVNALMELLKIEKDWIPDEFGTSLYIRPTMIATDAALGVHAAAKYKFFIILSPVGSYYANGMKPIKILVEEFHVRTALGGTGEAKCMGNYAASIYAAFQAEKKGYDQVLWLDAKEHKYCEEVGAMNIFFVIDGVVKTPALVGSILPGITRKSVIELLKSKNIPVEECLISMEEIEKAYLSGHLDEAFGSGTAAVISPVGALGYKGRDMIINGGEMGKISKMVYDEVTGVQFGKLEDKFNWIYKVN